MIMANVFSNTEDTILQPVASLRPVCSFQIKLYMYAYAMLHSYIAIRYIYSVYALWYMYGAIVHAQACCQHIE